MTKYKALFLLITMILNVFICFMPVSAKEKQADKTVGRKHLPILLGRRTVARIYIFFLAASYLPILIGYAAGIFPIHAFIALATIVLAVQTSRGVLRYSDEMKSLVPYLGKNVIINLATPALLAIGLMIAA